MKKIYVLAVGLMVLTYGVNVFADLGEDSPQDSTKSNVSESQDKDASFKSQEPSIIFGEYRYRNLDKLKEDLSKNPNMDLREVLEKLKGESILGQDFSTTSQVHRDQSLVEIALANKEKEKQCNQWWNRGEGLAVGVIGTLALVGGILLFQNVSIAGQLKQLNGNIPTAQQFIEMAKAALAKKDE